MFCCDSHVAYSAWAALEPGSTPDLLDVIAPNALEPPGPVPRQESPIVQDHEGALAPRY